MVYLLSQKFWRKNVDRLVAPNRYIVIDGSNYSVTGRVGDTESISENYTNSLVLGGFCPETELYTNLRRKKKGEDYSKKKVARYLEEFLKSRDFISAACLAMNSQAAYGDDSDCNVFIVLPGIVNKYLAKHIRKRMLKIIRYDGKQKFIFTQKDIEEAGKSIFSKTASKQTLREVLAGVGKAEKRYKLDDPKKDKDDDWDDWD